MTRLARVVAAGVPHHVTQRGNRRQQVFFDEGDYVLYKSLLSRECRAAHTEVWSYCLMPNHVHLILLPSDEDGLRAALSETHRRYTRQINERNDWRGYLWQGRFASFPMDEQYLIVCARYMELNPVRAGLVRRASDWKWSSARAHLSGKDDGLVFLSAGLAAEPLEAIRRSARTGRPLGAAPFLKRLEKRTGRSLAKQKPGPKRRGR